MTPLGAVVIGRNEGPRLRACLASLSACKNLVYVDSGSTDDSLAIAESFGATIVLLDTATPFTAARARNAGFDRLQDLVPDLTYIQFVDGDCEVVSGWLDKAVAFLDANSDVAAVCGQRHERFPQASIYNAMCDREWNTPIGPAQSCGGDSLVRVVAFKEVGGFLNDQVAHEEPELCGRLRARGWKIWRIDASMTLHDAAIYRIDQFYKRNRRAGIGITQYLFRKESLSDGIGWKIIARAVFWGLGLPLLIVALSLVSGILALVVAAIYPLKIGRDALKLRTSGRWSTSQAGIVAMLSMVSKVAEAHGTMEFVARHVLRRTVQNVVYK